MNLREFNAGVPASKSWLAPVCGDIECLSLSAVDSISIGDSIGVERVQFIQNSTEAVSATVTETSIVSGDILGSLTIPANSLVQGSTLRFVVRGFVSNALNDQITLRLYDGVTFMGFVQLGTLPASTNKFFVAEFDCHVKQVGVAGVASLEFNASYQQTIDGSTVPAMAINRSIESTNFATTVPFDIILTAQWTTLTGSLTITSIKGYRS